MFRPRLGHLLLEKGLLTEDELDDALRIHEETQRPLGDVLTSMNFISVTALSDALLLQQRWRPLGQMLVERGVLTTEQLADALDEQERSGRPLGEVVRTLFFVPATTVAEVLAEQYQLEVEMERGFGSGLRGEIERRHRVRRGQEADPASEQADEPSSEPRGSLSERLPTASTASDDERVRTLQAALDAREETISAIGLVSQRRAEEIERLRAEIADRDALIAELRLRVARQEPAAAVDGAEGALSRGLSNARARH